MTQTVLVAEITRAIDAAGTLKTELACTAVGWATRPTDTPPNYPIPPTLGDVGTLQRELFNGDQPFGAVKASYGSVSLDNTGRLYDGWRRDSFKGRPFVLRMGPLGGAYPADFETVLICSCDTPSVTDTEATLTLTDQSELLQKTVLNETFTGASMAEGGTALAGQAKQRYIGSPEWFGPAPVSVADGWGKLVYHVTTGRTNNMLVYDNGNPLDQETVVGNFWNFATEQRPGTFWIHYEGGSTFIRLGTAPVGDLRVYTSTVQNNSEPWSMAALLAEAGYKGQIIGAPIPNISCIVTETGTKYARLFDDAAANAGMWYGFDRFGRFIAEAFDVPKGVPAAELDYTNLRSLVLKPVAGMDAPLYRINVNAIQTWRSNYTAPSNWVRNKFEAEQWLYKRSLSIDSVLEKHAGARTLSMDLLIGPRNDVEWATFSSRLMRMFGTERCSFFAQLDLTPETMRIDLGQTVRVTWDRYELESGQLLRVIAIKYDLAAMRIDLTLWG